MRYLFLLCGLSYAGNDYSINPCIVAQEGSCASEEEAWDALQEQNPDCVIEEVHLEGMSGGQCCYDLVISHCGGGCGG